MTDHTLTQTYHMTSDNLNIDSMAEQFRTADNHQDDSNIIIKVVGVGGGGCNAVYHMYQQHVPNVNFVLCNTDEQALKKAAGPHHVLIGDGRGAGNKPDVAKAFAERDIEKIREIFDEQTQMVFITAGMGGGTGTGAAPIVAREAKACGKLTVGIVTIPFLWEGERKILKALDGVDEMARNVDALLVINNERLTEIYGDLDWVNAFGKADDTLSTAASSISDLINREGYINLDFQDVDTTLRDGGAAIISSGYGEGENRVTAAIQDALDSPLLKNTDILSSKRLLFNIYFSRDADQPFRMSEAEELTNFVREIDPDVDIISGVVFDESLGNKVRVTILAAGFEVTIREEEAETMAGRKRGAIKIGANTSASKPAAKANRERLTEEYGTNRNTLGLNYMALKPEHFDDDSVIERFEQFPTYTRDIRQADLSTPTVEHKNDLSKSSRQTASDERNAGSAGTIISW